MITQYVSAALLQARYERVAFGWLGYLPSFDGVWVLEETQKACEEELALTLERWLIASYQQGLEIPVVDGIDLAAVWDVEGAPVG